MLYSINALNSVRLPTKETLLPEQKLISTFSEPIPIKETLFYETEFPLARDNFSLSPIRMEMRLTMHIDPLGNLPFAMDMNTVFYINVPRIQSILHKIDYITSFKKINLELVST